MSRRVPAVVLLVLTALLAACGDDDEGGGGAEQGKGYDIEFAMAGVPGDPYYTVVKNGAREAGEDLGVNVQYNETVQYDFQEQTRLIRAAIARKPDGLIVSSEEPEVVNKPIKEAVDAGIPVIIVTAGGEESRDETGALAFFGQDEYDVGVQAGREMKKHDIERVVCLNPFPGVPALDARCKGLEDVYGKENVRVVAINQEDRTAARNGIQNALQGGDFDGALALSSFTGAEPALDAIQDAGLEDEVKLGGIDLSPRVLEAVRDGEMLFASDQQQFHASYMAVVYMTQFLEKGLRPPPFVQTGPFYVTKETAARTLALSEEGVR
jgi:simple sugar transport system substrate-binding protein